MKNRLLLVAIIFLIIFLPIAVSSFFIKYIPSGFQPPLGGTEAVYKERSVAQSFISFNNNLIGIGLTIKNPNLRNKKDLIFQLSDKDGVVIRSVKINGFNIPDGHFVKFYFDPIEHSANESYLFSLQAPESEQGDSLEVYQTSDVNWEQDLAYVSYYKPDNLLTAVISIFSEMMANLDQDRPFLIAYLLILFLLIVSFCYSNQPAKSLSLD